jgi:hypothetical protein
LNVKKFHEDDRRPTRFHDPARARFTGRPFWTTAPAALSFHISTLQGVYHGEPQIAACGHIQIEPQADMGSRFLGISADSLRHHTRCDPFAPLRQGRRGGGMRGLIRIVG